MNNNYLTRGEREKAVALQGQPRIPLSAKADSPLQGNFVDKTGVGAGIVDQLRATGLTVQAVSLHGGDTVSHIGANWRVPKRDLVGVVQVVLQQSRLKFAEALALRPVLTQELLNFKQKIDPATAHDSYAAWRERDHDDLVLALQTVP